MATASPKKLMEAVASGDDVKLCARIFSEHCNGQSQDRTDRRVLLMNSGREFVFQEVAGAYVMLESESSISFCVSLTLE